ncbi:MAG: right-handed parallel beta-helix repeat-containing protein [Anaerolineae bacterium]
MKQVVIALVVLICTLNMDSLAPFATPAFRLAADHTNAWWAGSAADEFESVTLTNAGWNDPTIGQWDPDARIATLTGDLHQPIVIEANDISLEGNGYALILPQGQDTGIIIRGRSGVTVRNLTLVGGLVGGAVIDSDQVTITNVIVTGAETQGIYLASSSNCTLTETDVQDSGIGIAILGEASTDNLLARSTVGHNATGILLEGAMRARLENNIIEDNGLYGLWLKDATSCILTGNVMARNRHGFYIQGLQDPYWDHQIDSTNVVDGRPILFLVDRVDLTIDTASAPGALYLVHCRRMKVRDLDLVATGNGVLLYDTHDSEIAHVSTTSTVTGIGLYRSHGNSISASLTYTGTLGVVLWNSDGNTVQDHDARFNWAGIELVNARGNVIRRNHLAQNERGMRMYGSSENVIHENTISQNTSFGIYLDSTFRNLLYRNNLIDNAAQVYATGSDDAFSQPPPIGGNHWSDWTGRDGGGDGFVDSPYTLGGVYDAYPWVHLGGWIQQDLPVRLWLPIILGVATRPRVR